MARGKTDDLSIAELERLLTSKRATVSKLNKRRLELQRQLDAVEREIQSLGGSDGNISSDRTAGGRVRNGISLIAAIESVLKGKTPMKVGDILSAVQAIGYRSTSDNFRGIINQTLIKETQFHSVGRGVYTLK